MYDKAKNLAEKFPLGKEQDAYEELNRYSRAERKSIKQFYDDLIREQKTVRSNEEKAKIAGQNETYNNILRNYWEKGEMIPVEKLRQLRLDDKLSDELYNKAVAMNDALHTREGVETELRRSMGDRFTSLSPQEQQRLIMLHMGVNEEKHRQAFDYLFERVVNGTATDALITEYYAQGYITPYDQERLKEYDSKWTQANKNAIQDAFRKFRVEMSELQLSKSFKGAKLRTIELSAESRFWDQIRLIDPGAKDFAQRLEDAYMATKTQVVQELIDNGLAMESGWIWKSPTPAGQRVTEFTNNQFQLPIQQPQMFYETLSGDVSSYMDNTTNVNLPDVPSFSSAFASDDVPVPVPVPDQELTSPEVSTPVQNASNPYVSSPVREAAMAVQNIPANIVNEDRTVDFTQGILQGVNYHVTDGYYAEGKAYRQGRSHFAVDLKAPVGTPVSVPETGTQWFVEKSGYNSKAGNFLTVSTTHNNGDVVELTYAHLSSVDVQNGDEIFSGYAIAKSGKTGNVTGPHLHVSAKLNGKTVDPRKINFGGGSPETTQVPGPTQTRTENPTNTQINTTSPLVFGSSQKEVPLQNYVSSTDAQNQMIYQVLFGSSFDFDSIFSSSADYGLNSR